METLADAIASAHRGLGAVVVIEGDAGIGKSRLVHEAAARARNLGFEAFESACDEAERTTPFGAVRRALGIDGLTPDPLRAAIAELLDGVEAARPSETMTPSVQFRVVERLGALVESLATDGPVLLVLDDLQWADPSTLLAVRSIAPRVERMPVLVVGLSRSSHDVVGLHRLTDDLVHSGATRLELGPLDEEAVASLATALLRGEPGNALLDRLRGAAGNPLLVTEYVSAVADATDATWATDPAAGDERLPLAFRRSVLRRVLQLPNDLQDVIRLAAVLGSTFAPRDLCTVLGRSAVELAPTVQQAVSAVVLEDAGDRLAFKHDLVRAAVYQDIPAGVRRALHREVGRKLGDAGADLLVVAHHVSLGADPEDPAAAEWLRRAAASAAPRAPAVAVELLERARDLLPQSPTDRVGVLGDLVLALAWSGRLAEAEALGREVLRGWIDPVTAITFRSALVRALTWQGRPAEALANIGMQAEEVAGGSDGAMLAAETALAAVLAFNFPAAAPTAARAEQLARASGNELALCQALSLRAWVAHFTGRPHEAVDLAQQAMAIADASEDGSAHLAHPYFFAGMPLVAVDRLDDAERIMQEGRRRADAMGLVWSLPLYHTHLGVKKFVAGEWDAAVAELEAGLAIADEIRLSNPMLGSAAAWLAVIQTHRDEGEAAARTIARALDRIAEKSPPLLNWAQAVLHESKGETTEAIALLQIAWDLFMAGSNRTDPWSAMALVRLCVRTGDLDRAAALLPVAEQQAARIGTPFMRGQELRCRGLVSGDSTVLVEAVAQYRQCPRPFELAAGCEDAGLGLAASGPADEAIPLLEESLAIYERVGALGDVTRVRATLRQHGVLRQGPRQLARARTGWDSLTVTERKVVDLVAQRLSNPEVAERLFISRHTVESHLKRIYRKLELSSRIELAAAAAQRASRWRSEGCTPS